MCYEEGICVLKIYFLKISLYRLNIFLKISEVTDPLLLLRYLSQKQKYCQMTWQVCYFAFKGKFLFKPVDYLFSFRFIIFNSHS